MRSKLLAATAAIALAAGAAWAQEATQPTTPPAVDNQTVPPATGDGALDGTGATDGATIGETGAMTGTVGDSWGSYSRMGDAGAVIAGGFTAEDLIDHDVVSMDGADIGTIEDLAVGPDGQVEYALVDVSSFFSVEERYVMLPISDLQRGEGDAADDEFVVNHSEETLDAMPRYTRSEDSWTVSTDE